MSLVSNKIKKIFLYQNRKIKVDSKVDIILSPEFYWVRVFDIPVKSTTQARHVLPTLFEDILETSLELSYQVQKLDENKYLCFAYSNKKIFEEIKKSGISISLVDGIYFAQNECKDFSQFKIDDKSFLYTPDNILVKVPNAIATQTVDLEENIDSIELLSQKVDIRLYNNILTSNQVYSIIAVLFILSLLNFYKLYDYKYEISNIDERIENIKQNGNLPLSMIQTEAIIKKYKNEVSLEIKKREALDYVLDNRDFNFKNIELEKNVLTLSLINTDKRKAESYISKKYKILSSNVNALSLNIRIKLWIN